MVLLLYYIMMKLIHVCFGWYVLWKCFKQQLTCYLCYLTRNCILNILVIIIFWGFCVFICTFTNIYRFCVLFLSLFYVLETYCNCNCNCIVLYCLVFLCFCIIILYYIVLLFYFVANLRIFSPFRLHVIIFVIFFDFFV